MSKHSSCDRWCVWCCQARSELGTARDPRKNGSASTSTQTTTATHPPKAPVARQHAHHQRTPNTTRAVCTLLTHMSTATPVLTTTSTHTTTATHPPKAPVAHQNAHQKRTSRPHIKAHTNSHTKPHISTAHDGTESRTPTETAHLKRTWGTSKVCSSEVCSPKVWCSKVWGSKAAGTGKGFASDSLAPMVFQA